MLRRERDRHVASLLAMTNWVRVSAHALTRTLVVFYIDEQDERDTDDAGPPLC